MSQKILLADDSVTIQKVVELTFMDEGVDVVSVGSGTDALAKLAEVAPDVLIADVHMPGATGYEVCRQAKRRRPGMPVLLLVGTFEPFDKDEFAACGADGFLKKPFDSQELVRQVRELLEAKPAEAEPAATPEPAVQREALAAPVPFPAAIPGPRPEQPSDLEATTPGAPAPPAAAASTELPVEMRLADADVDRIARRVVEILSEKVVREVSWEVVPDLAELIIKDRLRELEGQVE
ncbi:MAG: response regulator transcription factor [Acidobacteriota bacterium]